MLNIFNFFYKAYFMQNEQKARRKNERTIPPHLLTST